MLRRTAVLACVCAVIGKSFFPCPRAQEVFAAEHVPQAPFSATSTDTQEKNTPSPEKPAEDLTQSAQSTLELALKAISLSQGEDGIELWRLKAEWANMQREDGKIVVQEPKLTYFMKEEGKTLLVTSERGVIDQKEQILSFIEQVTISQDEKKIQGHLLVYNGPAKTMTFPQGGFFTGNGVSGSAQSVVWNLNRHIIEAEGEVSVLFSGSETLESSTSE